MRENREQITENRREKGMVLILTFIVMAVLTAITVAFLTMTCIQTKSSGYAIAGAKALWLAEAGVQKAIWNLKTPVGSGGQGENWTTTGTSENLGNGSYTMKVERWDFALAANGASATASSVGKEPVYAIDGNDTTHWESKKAPTVAGPEWIKITFPYTLTINKVRFLSTVAANIPKDYTWQVSTDGSSWTTVVTVTGNAQTDRTDEFLAQSDVNYLMLHVTAPGTDGKKVSVYTLKTIGSKITSTGTVSVMNRKIAQTAVADDATQTAYNEKDWNEIVPAT